MGDWRENLLEDEKRIAELLRSTRRVAVLGMKTEAQADQAAFYVGKYVAEHGAELVPVPVYYPEATEILGRKVYRKVADVPGDLDVVDVFRRPSDIPGHLPDLLAKRPRAVWFQLGIRNDAAAEQLARAGILVVQDRCLMVEWRRHVG
jgi:predicted CoA-binding protein